MLFSLALCVASAAAQITLPDPATGEIDGRTAVLYWPTLPNSEPLPVDGCEVHLVSIASPERQLREPCGKWFAPPADRYTVWLETADRISQPVTLLYAGNPFRGRGLAAMVPMERGGRVAVDGALKDGEEWRLVTARDGRIFDKRVRESSTLMPPGRVVAGRFDRESGDALALAKPVDVIAGGAATARPRAPANGSDLLIVLTKPPRAPAGETALELDGKTPDLLIDANRVVAVWYGVEARKPTVVLRSNSIFWAAREVALTPGRVTTIRARAERLPKLSVSIQSTAAPEKLELSVAERNVDATLGINELVDVPAEPLRVTLQADEWRFIKDVDLRDGRDGHVAFDLEPIAIRGTVYLGDEPSAAELAFRNAGDWVRVRTAADGTYHATLWNPGQYTVQVHAGGGPPYLEPFRAIDRSGTLDFHVPATRYTLRVRDAATGAPIAGARAAVGNIWDEGTIADRVVTSEDGDATLPRLRTGELTIEATADGYAPARIIRRVDGSDSERHDVEIRLQRERVAGRLTLIGARDAEAWAFAGDDLAQPIWQGRARDGVLELPFDRAWLLVRSAEAASTIRRWNGEAEWRLDPPAPPLTLSITRPSGESARSARVALWLDGVKLTGPPLAFAAWSTPAADLHGVWTARNLPPRATRILALPMGAMPIEAMASTIAYPWSSTTVRTAE